MNEITAALHLIAAAWPGKVEAEQLDLWRAAVAEHADRVPPGTVAQAAKTLVVTGGPFPPSLGEFLSEILGINDIEDAAAAWPSAFRPTNPIAHAATQAIGGQWALSHTERPEATRRAWIETYNAEMERWRRAVLLGQVEAPRTLAARGAVLELPERPKALADTHGVRWMCADDLDEIGPSDDDAVDEESRAAVAEILGSLRERRSVL